MNIFKKLAKISASKDAKQFHSVENEIPEIHSVIKGVQFNFRDGFSDRVLAKLNQVLETDPLQQYYSNLSRLFPKIIGFSFAILVLMGLILFVLHGTLSPDTLLGADRVDENNFISYLILDK